MWYLAVSWSKRRGEKERRAKSKEKRREKAKNRGVMLRCWGKCENWMNWCFFLPHHFILHKEHTRHVSFSLSFFVRFFQVTLDLEAQSIFKNSSFEQRRQKSNFDLQVTQTFILLSLTVTQSHSLSCRCKLHWNSEWFAWKPFKLKSLQSIPIVNSTTQLDCGTLSSLGEKTLTFLFYHLLLSLPLSSPLI